MSLCQILDYVDKWMGHIRHIALLCGTLDRIQAEKQITKSIQIELNDKQITSEN